MDESAAALIGEDGAEKNNSHNDGPCENNHPPSTEDSGDGKYPATSRNFFIDLVGTNQ